ncbi:hypothetical protein [Lentzea jiangxiensis]|uniref:Uncharacterized protein n=1 Tax=Lentzea jiangxiensis TaxID=641025 RepID=A0A1H0JWR3_9PSEU|nr:hypothetical protein [Lentzea jiangxiensis]SDO48087.1 hypothetical protein SAMN05421507_102669 [Lentzea jiangxiensis]
MSWDLTKTPLVCWAFLVLDGSDGRGVSGLLVLLGRQSVLDTACAVAAGVIAAEGVVRGGVGVFWLRRRLGEDVVSADPVLIFGYPPRGQVLIEQAQLLDPDRCLGGRDRRGGVGARLNRPGIGEEVRGRVRVLGAVDRGRREHVLDADGRGWRGWLQVGIRVYGRVAGLRWQDVGPSGVVGDLGAGVAGVGLVGCRRGHGGVARVAQLQRGLGEPPDVVGGAVRALDEQCEQLLELADLPRHPVGFAQGVELAAAQGVIVPETLRPRRDQLRDAEPAALPEPADRVHVVSFSADLA